MRDRPTSILRLASRIQPTSSNPFPRDLLIVPLACVVALSRYGRDGPFRTNSQNLPRIDVGQTTANRTLPNPSLRTSWIAAFQTTATEPPPDLETRRPPDRQRLPSARIAICAPPSCCASQPVVLCNGSQLRRLYCLRLWRLRFSLSALDKGPVPSDDWLIAIAPRSVARA